MKTITIAMVALAALASCKKDELPQPETDGCKLYLVQETGKVGMIICEGVRPLDPDTRDTFYVDDRHGKKDVEF